MTSHSKFSDAQGANTVPPRNNIPTGRVLSPSLNNRLHQLQISTPPRNGAFQFAAGESDAQLSTCELVNAPQLEGSVNVEYPPGSSHGQPSQRKQRKRRQKTLIAEENESLENEISSLNNKCTDLLEKSIKRQKNDLNHAKGLINRETDMVDMLCNALVTCQICNDRSHTAVECPQRYVYPIKPSANTVTNYSSVPCHLGTATTNHISKDLNGLENSEAHNGDADLLMGKGSAN